MAKPWTEGPSELLQHAADHLALGSDFDRRMAMISIDNAVELAVKTYLQLPKRVRGTDGPSRKEFEEKSRSFPDLLDLLENFGETKTPVHCLIGPHRGAESPKSRSHSSRRAPSPLQAGHA